MHTNDTVLLNKSNHQSIQKTECNQMVHFSCPLYRFQEPIARSQQLLRARLSEPHPKEGSLYLIGDVCLVLQVSPSSPTPKRAKELV